MQTVMGKKVRQKEGMCTPKTTEAKYLPDILPVLGFRSLPTDRESLRAIRRSASPVVIRPTQLSRASRMCRSWPAMTDQSFLTLVSHCDTSSISPHTCSIKVWGLVSITEPSQISTSLFPPPISISSLREICTEQQERNNPGGFL